MKQLHRRPYSVAAIEVGSPRPVRSPLPPVRVPHHLTAQETVSVPAARTPRPSSSQLPPIKVYTLNNKRCRCPTCSHRTLVVYGIVLMIITTLFIVGLIILHYFNIIDWFPFLKRSLEKQLEM
ncbi:unnamed protein product [Cylicocyclus nassatus]|uniref:Uncharacterized protein n=1 Tax=Cylicocyclus nassatus TaxID=53992 RepID=A0AA36M6Z6_CYLNA|nr:unnamed protein product [Cylicocyclus nassatus]